ncbi:YutD family protein [Paenibacillus sinopodophylli]|uniref:YutD family protein n=1 Tax=Paenibacillus sinopodophylli TaxID=1837342 RepID=UPI001FE25D47|nr:YutD family protein [Paenibacillus sinopodophylli]
MALIHIGGKSYEIVQENRNGWNPEAFRDRYSEVLERYDFIVGDWGYSQLRLKGFFRDNHQKATKDSNLSSMSDYINEYCNFGCAYFILEKTISTQREPEDFDLDADDQRPRLDGADLLAAVAGMADGSDSSDIDTTEVATAKEETATPSHERHSRPHNRENRHRSSNRSSNQEQKGEHTSTSAGEGRNHSEQQGSSKREHQRKGGYKGNDHRGKKPFRLAASETAAASAEPSRPNKKDTERH